MYRAIISVFDLIPKTDIELTIEIPFGIFKNKKEAEEEANSVKKVIFQTKPLSLRVITKKNKYIVDDDKLLTFKKVKNENTHKTMISEDDFEVLKDFTLKDLEKYFKNEYSFQIVAYKVEKFIISVDEYHHHYSYKLQKTIENFYEEIYDKKFNKQKEKV